MKKLIIVAALAFASPVFAADAELGMVLGTNMQDVHTKLVELGYEVRKTEMEHGEMEVYAVKGRTRTEVYVSPTTGKITRLKFK